MSETPGRSWGTVVYPIAVVVLLAAVSLLAFRLHQLREQIALGEPRANALAVRDLLSSELTTARGKTLVPTQEGHDLIVLVALTPYDCATCLDELEALALLDEMRDDLAVYGLMSYASPDEARQTQETFGLPFDIIPDAEGEMQARLAPPQTPWKIVWSVDEGRILFEDPRSMEEAERHAFLLRVGTL
jgi:peroxiredoxin